MLRRVAPLRPRAVVPSADSEDRRARGGSGRTLLVVGDLPANLLAELSERGATLLTADDLSQAFTALAEHAFDAVAVDPLTQGCGIDLVTAVKEDDEAHQHTLATLYGVRGNAKFLRGVRPPTAEVLAALRVRHARTPFVVLPSDGGWKYGVVIVPPHASVIRDGRVMPLISTLMTIHPESLAQPRTGLC